MNAFEQYANNDEQKMIDNLFTIKKSLLDIFNINTDGFRDTDSFTLKINGLDKIRCYYRDNKLKFQVNGIRSENHRHNSEKATDDVVKRIINKMKNKHDRFSITEYTRFIVEFSFTDLTDDVIHDIMLLVNGTEAKLRPKNVRSF